MSYLPCHHWIHGGLRGDRMDFVRSLGAPPELVATLDAHRQARGPYTAAGSLARALVPAVMTIRPDLVRRHDVELLSVAPEVSTIVPNSRETLTSMAIPAERTRFYARLRTRRIANGLVEFLSDSLPEGEPRTLMIDNVEHAEQTDLEFLAALVRRVDPARLTVILCSATVDIPDDELLAVLAAHAREQRVPIVDDRGSSVAGPPDTPADHTDPCDMAWAYVKAECTSDDPRLRLAYETLPTAERARLHDRRAANLSELDQQSLRLGAIPYHLERGADPREAGAQALYAAQDYCLCLGFYTAVVDYGYRALDIVDPRQQQDLWWMITIELTLALSILSRTAEAERLCDQARLLSTKPTVHMAAAYSTAMLYTRHNDPEDRDEEKAKAWLNSAIATASLIEDKSERAFQTAFYKNGLALVEVNLGKPSEALRLVDECIESLDRELQPDEHRLHRSVLKNNRARVYASLGRLDDALADYAVVIDADPNHAEHYLERGNILRRLGRYTEAFRDYQTAMQLSPPFPEIYYNRGDLRVTTGDTVGALTDFGYVVELNPDFLDAYVNSAGLHLEAGDLEAAYCDAAAGLARDQDNAHLEVVIGQVHLSRQQYAEARAAFDRAIRIDPRLVAALAGRAALAFALGDVGETLTDLRRAIEVAPDDAALRYNRAVAYQGAGRWDDALADLDLAAELAPDDPDIAFAREACARG